MSKISEMHMILLCISKTVVLPVRVRVSGTALYPLAMASDALVTVPQRAQNLMKVKLWQKIRSCNSMQFRSAAHQQIPPAMT